MNVYLYVKIYLKSCLNYANYSKLPMYYTGLNNIQIIH